MLLWSRGRTQTQRTTFDHPTLGEVTLNRSPRAKRISISVRPSGEVRLTLPAKGSESHAKQFLESRIEWILEARQRVTTPQHAPLSKVEIEELRAKAKSYLPQRVEQLAREFGFRYGRVTIRVARTKWGSCTGENNISLTLFLMQLPPHLIDFVILHELCHTVHHDHSPQFHAAVDRCTAGRERELLRELRQYRCGTK